MTNSTQIARWASSDRWLASTDGDASDSQPRTERELELSGRFHGPFNSEADASEWLENWQASLADEHAAAFGLED